MATLSSFMFMTLNGFTHGIDGDISWHIHGHEENQHAVKSMTSGNTLVFGRKTFEMMEGYWPTDMARANDPEVAEGMNTSNKIVFTNSLTQTSWENVSIVPGDAVEEMRRLKSSSPSNFTILGSGSLVSSFANAGLIDEYLIMIDPVAISRGSSFLQSVVRPMDLNLEEVKTFNSGVVLLRYTLK